MAKELSDFLKGGYEQINWPEDGTVNFEYIGQEIVETQYGDRVKLAIFDLIENIETAIYTASKKLLGPLFTTLKVEPGDKIAVRRTGRGFQTKYEVAIIERKNKQAEKAITAADVKEVFHGEKALPLKETPKKFKIEDALPFE